MMVKSRLALPADPPTQSADSEDEDSRRTGSRDGHGWREGLLPVLVVLLTAFPLAILLTLTFQLSGTVLGFFLTGLAGGYLAGPSRSRGLYVGVVGSTFACLIGIVFLVAVMSQTLQQSDTVMYYVSYVLWLSLAAPVNLFISLLGGTSSYLPLECSCNS